MILDEEQMAEGQKQKPDGFRERAAMKSSRCFRVWARAMLRATFSCQNSVLLFGTTYLGQAREAFGTIKGGARSFRWENLIAVLS